MITRTTQIEQYNLNTIDNELTNKTPITLPVDT